MISERKAYLLGVLAGDGSIRFRAHKYEYSVKCVGNPRDETRYYDEVLKPLFYSEFGVQVFPKLHDASKTYGFTVYSKRLYTELLSLGLPSGRKHPSLRVPKVVCSSQDLRISFLRGVMDTDGCLTFKKRYTQTPYYSVITLSSQTKEFVQQLERVMRSCGLRPVPIYDYPVNHNRRQEPTVINRLELNGRSQLACWMEHIGFWNPKHTSKLLMYGKEKYWERQDSQL